MLAIIAKHRDEKIRTAIDDARMLAKFRHRIDHAKHI